jgi:hypothetical protein
MEKLVVEVWTSQPRLLADQIKLLTGQLDYGSTNDSFMQSALTFHPVGNIYMSKMPSGCIDIKNKNNK